ncbi:hypothetical protein ACQUW5_06190 [Legionella sp. CNM-1927-20]|uniref:hypothetical protein n=1 Tax=Legionella sp. CNM-1927-20 TaxID=3422221 RepID=UPI00403B0891
MVRIIEKSSELQHRALNSKEAIANLAYKLTEGTSNALIAIIEFKELIDGLSDNELKNKILGLSINVRNDQVSIGDILSKIDKGMCVKRAAQQITKILNDHIANEILEINLDSARDQNKYNQCLILYTIVRDIDEGLKAIKKYLQPLSKEELLKVVTEKNQDKNSLLHIAARDPNDNRRLLEILNLIDPKHRLAVIKEVNCNGDPLIHLLADKSDNFASLKEALSLIPPEDRLQAINAKDRLNGNTILHNMAMLRESPEGIVFTLESLPKEMRLKALQTKNEDGHSLLDILVKNSNERSLQAILNIVPEAKTEIDALTQGNKANASECSASFINVMAKNNAASGNHSNSTLDKTIKGEDKEEKKRWIMPQRKKW